MENKVGLAREIAEFIGELRSQENLDSDLKKDNQKRLLDFMGRLMTNRNKYTKDEYEQLDTLLNAEYTILFANQNKSR